MRIDGTDFEIDDDVYWSIVDSADGSLSDIPDDIGLLKITREDARSADIEKNERDVSSVEPLHLEIGSFVSDDGSVFKWSIDEMLYSVVQDNAYTPGSSSEATRDNGFVLKLSNLLDESSQKLIVAPFDMNERWTCEQAYDAFLDIVYSSDEKEHYYWNVEKPAVNAILSSDGWQLDDSLRALREDDLIEAIRTLGFEDFAELCKSVNGSIEQSKSEGNDELSTANESKLTSLLLIRYPFVSSYNTMYQENAPQTLRLNATSVSMLPGGWLKSFGVDMLEDLRDSAYDEDKRLWLYRLCNMCPEQVKEKFGELRWYGKTYGCGQQIVDGYTAMSRITCSSCGATGDVRMTNGYIMPLCRSCYTKHDDDYAETGFDSLQSAIEHTAAMREPYEDNARNCSDTWQDMSESSEKSLGEHVKHYVAGGMSWRTGNDDKKSAQSGLDIVSGKALSRVSGKPMRLASVVEKTGTVTTKW